MYDDLSRVFDRCVTRRVRVQLLDSNPPGIGHGLGDWMPVQGTSTEFTGPGFLRMSYLAFANITVSAYAAATSCNDPLVYCTAVLVKGIRCSELGQGVGALLSR